ncbi:MAG: hypothetical protein MJ246_01980 [Clostridia bacterium]|nr:hypothetical protein [Clostridia bacterium]
MNNYKLDCDLTGYRDTTDKPAIGDITQTVKTPIGTTFMNRGFLEKAFSKEESNKIYADTNSFADASTDGAPTTDKVRLMNFYDLTLDKEVVSLNSLKYGFATGTMIPGLRTNRMGFLTDLAYAFVSSSTQVDKKYPEYSEIKKYSGVWETSTYSNSTNYKGVHQMGSSNSLPTIYNENGVRPQITLDMSSLGTLVSNDGQIVDGSSSYPYNFESKLLLHTNEITGDDLVLASPGNTQIDIDMFPGNTISGVYLTSDKTNQINVEGHPDQIIMPNTNYEVYVDVDVTLEGAINATNLGSRYIEKIINSDDYITAINSANEEGKIPNSSKISSALKEEVVDTIGAKVASTPYALTDGSTLKNDIIEIVGFGPIYTDENEIEYTMDDLVIYDLENKARWNIADTDGNNLYANVFVKKTSNSDTPNQDDPNAEYILVFTGTEDEIRLFERVYTGDNEFAYVNDDDRSVTTDTVDDSDKND